MPDETPIATPAADAPIATPTPEAKPPTLQALRAVLSANTPPPPQEKDPLFDPESPDPLFDTGESDPLLTGAPEAEADVPLVEEVAPAEAGPLTEVAPEVLPEAGEDEGRKRLNINRKNEAGEFIHPPRERAIMRHAAEQGISYSASEKELFGGPVVVPVAVAEAVPVETAKTRTSTDIMSEITKLKADRREARSAYDTEKASDLDDQLADLTIEYAKASVAEVQAERDALQKADRAQASFTQSVEASREAAVTAYPDANVPGTALSEAVLSEYHRQLANNPNYFSDPEWPEALAAKVATRLGIAPVIKTTAPAPPKAVTPKTVAAPVRRATPVPAPGAVSGALPRPEPVAELGDKLKAAHAARDQRQIRLLTQEIENLPRRAA